MSLQRRLFQEVAAGLTGLCFFLVLAVLCLPDFVAEAWGEAVVGAGLVATGATGGAGGVGCPSATAAPAATASASATTVGANFMVNPFLVCDAGR
jgi:hypothetical protein